MSDKSMETETLDTCSISSSTKTSSWSIVRGTIDDSVTFESSISAVDSDSDSDAYQNAADKRKPPLILRRPSSDSGPCEITICLAHQHEVRQVYVRSTARIYEIYCTEDENGGGEYLCTVRCSLAAHNDEQVRTTDSVWSMPASYGSNRCGEEGHARTESGSSISEDGWVDVDPSGFDGGDRSDSNKKESYSEKNNQDFFEATAEISDADPVKSLTLRFLSIQCGGYIYIDEIYIYADPVLSEDSDSSPNMPENTSGSNLMAMLVPTLLQMSKSRMSQMQQHRNDSAAEESRKSLSAEQKATSPAITSGAYGLERMPCSEVHRASVHMSQPEVSGQETDPQNRPCPLAAENTSSCSHIERTLNELLYRIVRIENFCLRFEENMLNPISSMEARLEKVEQQLKSFFKNTESCRPGYSKISAPECHNSDSSSTCTNGNDSHGCTKSDSEKNDDCCREEILVPPSEACLSASAVQQSDRPGFVEDDDCCSESVSVPPFEVPSFANGVQPSDKPITASAPQLHRSLVVTAPDFSLIDDEEENDVSEAVKDSPKDNCKKPMSIDNALASALAGFLSMASPVEKVLASPTVERTGNDSSVNVNGSDEAISISHEEAAPTEVTASVTADNSCEETTKAVGVSLHPEEEYRKEYVASSFDCLPDVEKDNMKDYGLSIELPSLEDVDATSQALVSDFSNNPAILNGTLSSDDSVAASELNGGNMDSSSGKGVKENPDVLWKILELPIPATVDFQIPILDVRFSSLENSSAKSSLEALLVDTPKSQIEVLCMREDNESSLSEPTDLVVMEGRDSATCEASINQLFSLNSFDSCCLSSNTEEERLDPALHQDTSDQDISASLI